MLIGAHNIWDHFIDIFVCIPVMVVVVVWGSSSRRRVASSETIVRIMYVNNFHNNPSKTELNFVLTSHRSGNAYQLFMTNYS